MNERKLKRVEWTWNYGLVYTKLQFESNEIEIRRNDKKPPTEASHDIAHFICGFNGGIDWDYEDEPNHLAEFNAVFVENMLCQFCHYYYHQYKINMRKTCSNLDTYMKWFAEKYYHIDTDHPCGKSYPELKEEFFQKINFDVICKFFIKYHQCWVLELLCKSSNFNLSVVMDSDVDYEFEPLYNYLTEVKDLLLN